MVEFLCSKLRCIFNGFPVSQVSGVYEVAAVVDLKWDGEGCRVNGMALVEIVDLLFEILVGFVHRKGCPSDVIFPTGYFNICDFRWFRSSSASFTS